MAQAELSIGFDWLRGKLKRDSEVVSRMKEYRADDGTLIKYVRKKSILRKNAITSVILVMARRKRKLRNGRRPVVGRA